MSQDGIREQAAAIECNGEYHSGERSTEPFAV